MRHVLAALIAVAVLFGAAPANAFMPDFDRWYVEGRGGLGLPPSPETNFPGGSGSYEAEDGYSIAAAVGTYIAPNTRVELELGITQGEDGVYKLGGAAIPHTGEAHVYSGLFNMHFEIPIPNEPWRPYFGGGVGFAVFDIDNLGGGGFQIDDKDTTFNAAFHFGLDIPLNDMFVLTSRLTSGITTEADFGTTTPGLTVTKGSQFYVFFSAGIRFHLGAIIP